MPNMDEPVVVRLPEHRRFELREGSETVGFATFRGLDGVLTVPHVETHPQYRGQGRAAQLMHGMLAEIRAAGESIVPLCPYAASFIAEHPEYADLVHDPRT